ncbi:MULTISPECIES: hypothetical protein [unclassified Bradyrhizobium]|uniref:hypothetical protein n=1 Tax=unclassified Bradyrhizobium TaxID=2631580 RepID=UPI001FF88B1A|nr:MULTISPECIES: hypothetical protein [unclassified Bradyrhizobium]MCK1707616.1 hypothetical protein [Bradyrhizobium sp. 143]MCK1724827.1 hypothetical protein [Bradyrhizobium sp. 142]
MLHIERQLHDALADAEVWRAVLALGGFEALRRRRAEGHSALLLAEGVLEYPVARAAGADAKAEAGDVVVKENLVSLAGIEPGRGEGLSGQLHLIFRTLGRPWEDRACSRALINARSDCWYLNDFRALQGGKWRYAPPCSFLLVRRPALGTAGRWFESSCPDQCFQTLKAK